MTAPLTIDDRKREMFAAQTHSAMLARQIYEAQRANEPDELVGTLIEQKAQAEATWLRLSQELHSEVSARNLVTFLDRVDEGNARTVAAVEEAVRGLGKRLADLEEGQSRLAGQLNNIGERLDEAERVIESHNESRDRSTRERAALEQGRKENRAAIEQVRAEAKRHYQELSAQLVGLREQLDQLASERQAGGER